MDSRDNVLRRDFANPKVVSRCAGVVQDVTTLERIRQDVFLVLGGTLLDYGGTSRRGTPLF